MHIFLKRCKLVCVCGYVEPLGKHGVHSWAPDVLCRVTSKSGLSLWIVDVRAILIQRCHPAESLTFDCDQSKWWPTPAIYEGTIIVFFFFFKACCLMIEGKNVPTAHFNVNVVQLGKVVDRGICSMWKVPPTCDSLKVFSLENKCLHWICIRCIIYSLIKEA